MLEQKTIVHVDYPPSVSEISPTTLSFMPIHAKTSIYKVFTVYQGMLDSGNVATNERDGHSPHGAFNLVFQSPYQATGLHVTQASLIFVRPWLPTLPY